MPILERLTSSNILENSKSIWRHRFNNINEYLQTKSLEVISNSSRVFTQALNRTKIFIEEGCNNALCGASHVMAMSGLEP